MFSSANGRDSSLILVVDDDITIRFMVRESLEQIGFQVAEAENGEQAIEVVSAQKPDLILLDVMMPVMDGFDACERIRALPEGKYTPILMMTGLDDLDSINRSYQVGATDFATKPINYLLLSHRLLYMLRSKETADDLRSSQSRLDHAQRIAKLGYWEWDFDTDLINWSDQVGEIFDLPTGRSFGDLHYFFQNIHKKEQENVIKTVQQARHNKRNYGLEHRVVSTSMQVKTVYQEAEIIFNDAGDAIRLMGTIQDITERKKAENKIERLSHYDKVTGLPNRVFLRRKLNQAITNNRNSKQVVALLTLDLDHFKRLNDTLGHTLGDEMLREVGKRLGTCITNFNAATNINADHFSPTKSHLDMTLAHFGGDEFVVMLDGLSKIEDAAIISRQINKEIARPITIDGKPISISVSIGISTFPDDGADVDSLLKQSSAALHHAKSEGRNCYKFFTSSMNARAFERLSLEINLRKALEENQFMLFYQPKVSGFTGDVVSMEALIRWRHPELGMVSPAEFIPVAEQTGLIIPLGEWIFAEACRHVQKMQQEGLHNLTVAVNLSGAQFDQENLPRKLSKIVQDTGISPAQIELEITESLIMNNVERAITILNELRELGFSIAIDDFGTGYSSLSYLKRFPISTLKIDQSFIRDINHDHDDASIVEAVIRLAHSLRLKVVAEGVEDQSQLEILRKHNCDMIQGYFYSRPLAAEDFIEWAKENQADLLEQTKPETEDVF